ncbi:MAG: capsule biosynthesis protein [Rhodobacterales bacterium]|nr:MAG: capsule biosynthesis protein [Rhodobacterales bacterium]
MTTRPRAKKFRIRRGSARDKTGAARDAAFEDGAPEPAEAAPRQINPLEESVLGGTEDGFPDEGFATAGRGGAGASASAPPAGADAGAAAPPPRKEASAGEGAAAPGAETDLASIRKEGLTGRQLRMARRLAQKHGLPATSDYDAVRLLRAAGIDPFHRANMLELVSAEPGTEPARTQTGPQPLSQIPRTLPGGAAMPPRPSPRMIDPAERARSVMEIQRDIVRRRRRKLMLLMVRLAFFVGLPTLMAGYYYYRVATPMYATRSAFVIQKADVTGGSGLGSLFAGSGLATSQDSISAQIFLSSRDAMLRLDEDLGFKAHFQQEWIDPLQRLAPDASNEETYKLYQRFVRTGYDPTEGIIRLEVIAATPDASAAFAQALIGYAEERVDNLTQRSREDKMTEARAIYEEAEAKRAAAQAEVLRLQTDLQVLDPTSETGSVMSQVTAFETELNQKRLQLSQLLDNARPNQARVDGVRGDIARLEELIADLRSKLTSTGTAAGASASGESLAQIAGQLAVAQSDLEIRNLMMQQALQQLETARIEADKQTRYFEMGVRPVAPDEPTYPRAFEDTVLAFLIFSGIYLMVSLTASILREQVSG